MFDVLIDNKFIGNTVNAITKPVKNGNVLILSICETFALLEIVLCKKCYTVQYVQYSDYVIDVKIFTNVFLNSWLCIMAVLAK